jgi:cold shock protein
VATGTVKWFDNKKGYGFIVDSSSGADIFVHFEDIGGGGYRSLEEGERVAYEIETGRKGFRARRVVKS